MKYAFKIYNRKKQFATHKWATTHLPRNTYYFWRNPTNDPNEVFWQWEFRNKDDLLMCKLGAL